MESNKSISLMHLNSTKLFLLVNHVWKQVPLYTNVEEKLVDIVFTYLLNNINRVKSLYPLNDYMTSDASGNYDIASECVEMNIFRKRFYSSRNCFLLRICSLTWNVILPIFTLNVWQKYKIMQKTLHKINAYGIAQNIAEDILSKISSKLIPI